MSKIEEYNKLKSIENGINNMKVNGSISIRFIGKSGAQTQYSVSFSNGKGYISSDLSEHFLYAIGQNEERIINDMLKFSKASTEKARKNAESEALEVLKKIGTKKESEK